MEYTKHYSVLKDECLDFLIDSNQNLFSQNKEMYYFADLTFGGGGHSFEILKRRDDIYLYACDQDPEALKNGKQTIEQAQMGSRMSLLETNFEDFPSKIDRKVDGVLIDLGVSSHHFDSAERGFSFRFDAPLDMRMNPNSGDPSASDLVNSSNEDELSEIFFKYGEERLSKRIAEKIIEVRSEKKIETTKELEDIIFHCYPKKWRFGKTNPSTRVFQALRIKVNRELEVLENVLDRLPQVLNVGARVCVISFHSLEDRIVKHHFKALAKKEELLRMKILTKKPITPGEKELSENKRSRSAKLRVIERID